MRKGVGPEVWIKAAEEAGDQFEDTISQCINEASAPDKDSDNNVINIVSGHINHSEASPEHQNENKDENEEFHLKGGLFEEMKNNLQKKYGGKSRKK